MAREGLCDRQLKAMVFPLLYVCKKILTLLVFLVKRDVSPAAPLSLCHWKTCSVVTQRRGRFVDSKLLLVSSSGSDVGLECARL